MNWDPHGSSWIHFFEGSLQYEGILFVGCGHITHGTHGPCIAEPGAAVGDVRPSESHQ